VILRIRWRRFLSAAWRYRRLTCEELAVQTVRRDDALTLRYGISIRTGLSGRPRVRGQERAWSRCRVPVDDRLAGRIRGIAVPRFDGLGIDTSLSGGGLSRTRGPSEAFGMVGPPTREDPYDADVVVWSVSNRGGW
jgi:hypothetical protein